MKSAAGAETRPAASSKTKALRSFDKLRANGDNVASYDPANRKNKNTTATMTWTTAINNRLQATNVLRKQVWALSAPYFRSEEKWKARAMLAAIVALNLALVYMAVLFNDWNRIFYDALQEKDKDVFWEQLWRFTYLAFGFIVIAVYKFYLTQLLEMRWRAWMTAHYLQRWLSNQAFYHLELLRFVQRPNADGNPDNPDQRIAEDIRDFTGLCLSLVHGPAQCGGDAGELCRHSVGPERQLWLHPGGAGVQHSRLHGVGGGAVLPGGQRHHTLCGAQADRAEL